MHKELTSQGMLLDEQGRLIISNLVDFAEEHRRAGRSNHDTLSKTTW